MRMAVRLIAILLTVLLIPAASALAVTKVGVIDMRKCVQLTDEGKVTYAALKSEVDRIEEDLKRKEKEIEEIRNKLEKGATVLSEAARMTLEGDLRRKSRSYRDLYQDSQARIRQLEMDRTRPIFNKLVELIKDIGKRDKYDLIIDSRAGLVYFGSQMDITSQVIQAYNQKYPAPAGAKPTTK